MKETMKVYQVNLTHENLTDIYYALAVAASEAERTNHPYIVHDLDLLRSYIYNQISNNYESD